jgi:hypothetical protein
LHLPAGPAVWANHAALGRFLLRLDKDCSWILRRVETVEFLDDARLERRTTIDIDCAKLRLFAAEAGIQDCDELPIPIADLPKALLLDVDVRDREGNAVSVAVSDRDSAAAQLQMLACLATLDVPSTAAQPAHKIDPATLNADIHQKLFAIAVNHPEPSERTGLEDPTFGGEVAYWNIHAGLTISQAEVDQWRSFFDYDEFAEYVLKFSIQYMLMTSLGVADHEVQMIKLRHVEAHKRLTKPTLADKLGVSSFFFLLDAPAAGRAAREHLRLVAPHGTFIDSIGFIALRDSPGAVGPRMRPPASIGRYQSRLTAERGVVYSKGVARASYTVIASLRPMVSQFVRPALYSVLASLLLLAGGLACQIRWGTLSHRENSVEAAVTVLLVFPSIASAYLAREGEHQVLTSLLGYPRIAVALSAVATVAAAAVVVAGADHFVIEVVWGCCTGVCFVVVALLACIHFACSRSYADVEATAEETEDLPILQASLPA